MFHAVRVLPSWAVFLSTKSAPLRPAPFTCRQSKLGQAGNPLQNSNTLPGRLSTKRLTRSDRTALHPFLPSGTSWLIKDSTTKDCLLSLSDVLLSTPKPSPQAAAILRKRCCGRAMPALPALLSRWICKAATLWAGHEFHRPYCKHWNSRSLTSYRKQNCETGESKLQAKLRYVHQLLRRISLNNCSRNFLLDCHFPPVKK